MISTTDKAKQWPMLRSNSSAAVQCMVRLQLLCSIPLSAWALALCFPACLCLVMSSSPHASQHTPLCSPVEVGCAVLAGGTKGACRAEALLWSCCPKVAGAASWAGLADDVCAVCPIGRISSCSCARTKKVASLLPRAFHPEQ